MFVTQLCARCVGVGGARRGGLGVTSEQSSPRPDSLTRRSNTVRSQPYIGSNSVQSTHNFESSSVICFAQHQSILVTLNKVALQLQYYRYVIMTQSRQIVNIKIFGGGFQVSFIISIFLNSTQRYLK